MRHQPSSILAALVLAVSLTQAVPISVSHARSLLAQTASLQSRSPDGLPVHSGSDDEAIATLESGDVSLAATSTLTTKSDTGLVGASARDIALADATASPNSEAVSSNERNGFPVWLWLVPLALLGVLIWAFSRRRNSSETEADEHVAPDPVESSTPIVGTASTDATSLSSQPEVFLTPEATIVPPPETAIASPAEEPAVSPPTAETIAEVEAPTPEPAIEPLEESAPLEPVPLVEESLTAASLEDAIAPLEATPHVEEAEEVAVASPLTEPIAEAEVPASEPTLEPLSEPSIESLEPKVGPLEESAPLEPLPLVEEPIATTFAEAAIAPAETVLPPIEEPPVIPAATETLAEVEAPAPESVEAIIESLPEPVIEPLKPAVEPLEESLPLEPLPLIEKAALSQFEETVPEEELASEAETALESEPVAPISSPPAADQAPTEPIAPPPIAVPSPSAMPPLMPPIVAGAAGLAMGAAAMINSEEEAMIEASKYNVVGRPVEDLDLADVDQGLIELPDGYGESRIVLLPRDPEWAYAYWDIPNEHKEDRRRQGGQRLALRLYDVTDIDLAHQNPHSLQQYDCEELARNWYLPIPVSDRDYLTEIGYLTPDGRWLVLARSAPIHVPPVYPSDWVEDHFISVNWDENLQGQTFLTLTHPSQRSSGSYPIHERLFGLA
ncbi:MAG TPA: DUF4912 domain-containing protein, partial [Trichocoleus sp.]